MDLPILVDSNIYIGLLKRHLDPAKVLFEHYATANLVTCGMVRLEVFRGIIGPRAKRQLEAFMSVMLCVPTDEKLWQEATELAWRMDRAGQVMQAPDLVIASCALRVGASVLTNDSDFRRVPGLHVLSLPDDLR